METETNSRRLTLDQKLNVAYCIPDWLKCEQIKANLAKVKVRIEPGYDLRKEPIAVVNYGPSLNDTWEQIKDFKYVMTCSGAHKFLVERGIIPTHHVDLDPRKHKIELLGQPQKGTEYFIASTVHPELLDHLAGFDVKLWHIFDTDEEGMRILPPGEWYILGGCSVGVRTLTLARFLGFTNLSVFGMDGSHGPSGKHAGPHPNQKNDDYVVDYEGKEYKTSPSMLEAAKNTFHELDVMKDVNCVFHGHGLVQEMAKRYQRKSTQASVIAFSKPKLISAEYRELNRRLHKDNLSYGVGGAKHAPLVIKLVESISKTVKFPRVLDYGCGRSYLSKALPFAIDEYDPAIPGKDQSPRQADLVVSTDVMEHIEPNCLDAVLDDIRRCARHMALLVIHTGPSHKTLADGRNSHLIIEGEKFWREKVEQFFVIPEKGLMVRPPLLYFIVAPKPRKSITAMGNKVKSQPAIAA